MSPAPLTPRLTGKRQLKALMVVLVLVMYIEAISNKQGELENYVSDGYKTALTEERRRFCFLVEKQCAVAKSAITYHAKVSGSHRSHWSVGPWPPRQRVDAPVTSHCL
ncbi:hypothetical protein llap_22908 [Limosa lapponica baueri]|uniref:IMD domain-containing protein n=1 Tax=Limosa lapponica baueri TaxID=1758121 RepID=A0A2I0SZ13_LIMLA|nr:hypothetical protein llap_22908 [Limosa lapponica baueri]